MKEEFKLIGAVYLLFRKDDKILLLRRLNTGYEDGKYGLVAGKVGKNESLTFAAVREAKEESGVEIDPKDLVLKVVMSRRENKEWADFFFEIKKWKGEISNIEPNKCSDLSWFPIDNLPENTISCIRQVIECYKNEIFYTEFGW